MVLEQVDSQDDQEVFAHFLIPSRHWPRDIS